MTNQDSVYSPVITITEDYLGPAAPRFIGRLSSNHLNKPADQLTASDLPKLVVWIRLAVTLITDDPATVEEYVERLNAIAAAPAAHSRSLH